MYVFMKKRWRGEARGLRCPFKKDEYRQVRSMLEDETLLGMLALAYSMIHTQPLPQSLPLSTAAALPFTATLRPRTVLYGSAFRELTRGAVQPLLPAMFRLAPQTCARYGLALFFSGAWRVRIT